MQIEARRGNLSRVEVLVVKLSAHRSEKFVAASIDVRSVLVKLVDGRLDRMHLEMSDEDLAGHLQAVGRFYEPCGGVLNLVAPKQVDYVLRVLELLDRCAKRLALLMTPLRPVADVVVPAMKIPCCVPQFTSRPLEFYVSVTGNIKDVLTVCPAQVVRVAKRLCMGGGLPTAFLGVQHSLTRVEVAEDHAAKGDERDDQRDEGRRAPPTCRALDGGLRRVQVRARSCAQPTNGIVGTVWFGTANDAADGTAASGFRSGTTAHLLL